MGDARLSIRVILTRMVYASTHCELIAKTIPTIQLVAPFECN